MDNKSYYNTVLKVWQGVIKEAENDYTNLNLDLEIHQKLLKFFQVGNFYYYVFNVNTSELDLVSDHVETVLGYHPSEMNIQLLFTKIHPEDQPYVINFENAIVHFLKELPFDKVFEYKISYDFRMEKKDGTYVRILHQSLTIQQYADGGIEKALGLDTDISHLKKTGKPTLSFIGLEGNPSYIDVNPSEKLVEIQEYLSTREKEILQLIIKGESNKMIAATLKIAEQTVETHRKNMIQRNNLKNTPELVAKAIMEGWL